MSTKIDFAEIKLTKENFNINIQTDKGRRGRDRMIVGLQLPMQSVPITTDVVGSTPAKGEVYNIM